VAVRDAVEDEDAEIPQDKEEVGGPRASLLEPRPLPPFPSEIVACCRPGLRAGPITDNGENLMLLGFLRTSRPEALATTWTTWATKPPTLLVSALSAGLAGRAVHHQVLGRLLRLRFLTALISGLRSTPSKDGSTSLGASDLLWLLVLPQRVPLLPQEARTCHLLLTLGMLLRCGGTLAGLSLG